VIMTPEQEVTDDNRTFKAKLIRLADESGLGEGGFAVWLGYTIGHISKVKNGHLPVDRTLDLLLETLEENHRLKQEVARVRGAAAELMGAAMPYPRHTEAPATLNGNASSGVTFTQPKTAAEALALAEELEQGKHRVRVPSFPKPKPALGTPKFSRGTQRPAATAPRAKADPQ